MVQVVCGNKGERSGGIWVLTFVMSDGRGVVTSVW